MSLGPSGSPMLELSVGEVVLEAGAAADFDAQQLVRQALALLAERLQRSAPLEDRRLERLVLNDFSVDTLRGERGAEALAEALHTRLMEAWR